MPETARLKTLIGWLNLDASFIYSTTVTEKASIPAAINSQKDMAKVEAYERRKIEGLAQAALNFVSPLTAVLNTEGIIILVNSAWRSAAMLYPKLKGGSLGCEGVNYLAVCEKAMGLGSEEANKVARSIREVIAFPKTASGGDPLTGAPTPITPAQRKETGVDTPAVTK